MKKNEEDLGIVFVPKEEAIWTKVKEAREASIKSLEESLIIEREVLKLAKKKLQNFQKSN